MRTIKEVKSNGIEFIEMVNRRLSTEAEIIRLEEAEAWNDKLQADEVEALIEEIRNITEYIDSDYIDSDYIDSDRYTELYDL